jgi:hypothetical protein
LFGLLVPIAGRDWFVGGRSSFDTESTSNRSGTRRQQSICASLRYAELHTSLLTPAC